MATTLTHEDVEILIYASAVDSFRDHVARTKRALQRAASEYEQALDDLQDMEFKLNVMRDRYLSRAA